MFHFPASHPKGVRNSDNVFSMKTASIRRRRCGDNVAGLKSKQGNVAQILSRVL